MSRWKMAQKNRVCYMCLQCKLPTSSSFSILFLRIAAGKNKWT
ncbi:unnamed protein product [Arabidopsis halleri]